MSHHGWRIPTQGLAKAEQYALDGKRLNVPKSQAIVAVKKIATSIGLRAADMLLIDTLAAITQPQDWEAGRRAIVWPSNAYLMEQCGFSHAGLKRHLRNLAELGIVSFRDSPNGKRWGRRDDDGNIIDAFGIDLGPLAARTAEFEAIHARLVEEKNLCVSLRRSITVSRRMIYARIEKALENGLQGPWNTLRVEFGALLTRLPDRFDGVDKLLDIADWFKAFKEKVEEAFAAAFEWPDRSDATSPAILDTTSDAKTPTNEHSARTEAAHETLTAAANEAPPEALPEVTSETAQESQKTGVLSSKVSPMGFTGEPHILTTNQPHLVNSNSAEENARRKITQKPQPTIADQNPQNKNPRAENIEGENIENSNLDNTNLEDIQWDTNTKNQSTEVELTTVMAACPEFAELARGFADGYVRTWHDLHRAAGQIRPMTGISEDAWNVAQKKLGPMVAAAAIGLIYEKYAKGEVAQPGGYLRGIIAKNIEGKLHLQKSFYGRMKRTALAQ